MHVSRLQRFLSRATDIVSSKNIVYKFHELFSSTNKDNGIFTRRGGLYYSAHKRGPNPKYNNNIAALFIVGTISYIL